MENSNFMSNFIFLLLVLLLASSPRCFAQQGNATAGDDSRFQKGIQDLNAGRMTPAALEALEEGRKREQPGASPAVGIFLGGAELNQGRALMVSRKNAEAEVLFKKAYDMRLKKYGAKDWLLAPCLESLALCAERNNNKGQALDYYKRAVSLGWSVMRGQQKLSDPRVTKGQVANALAHDLNCVGRLSVDLQQYNDAESACRYALSLEQSEKEAAVQQGTTIHTLQTLYQKTNQVGKALQLQSWKDQQP
jgi:hypothetical protein